MTSLDLDNIARAARICTASDAKVVPFPRPYQRHGYEPDDWYEDEIEDDDPPEPSDRLWWAWLAVIGGGLALWLLPWLAVKVVWGV